MEDTEAQVVDTQEEAKQQDIYARQVEDFVKSAAQDLDGALDRFGFTVWHSVPQKQQVTLKEELGFRPLEASDYYNRGTALALEENYSEAETDLRAALKKDPDFALAAFNLAVCLEKTQRVDDARKMYGQYLKILDRARGRRDLRFGTDVDMEKETARIRQHLETLGKA